MNENMGKTENGVKPGVLNGLLFGRAVPEPVLAALLYLAFCFAYWPGTGASLAAAVVTYSSLEAMTSILGNELVAFLMAGILPFVATELLANVSIRSATTLGTFPYAPRRLSGRTGRFSSVCSGFSTGRGS